MIRKQFIIGGSDVAPILNESNFRKDSDVYLEKIEGVETKNTVYLSWGHILEPFILKRYENETGIKTKERARYLEFNWMGGNIDALGVDAKSHNEFYFRKEFDERENIVPPDPFYQCLWYINLARKFIDPKIYSWDLAIMLDSINFRSKLNPDLYLNIQPDSKEYFFIENLVNMCDFKIIPVYWNQEKFDYAAKRCYHFWRYNLLEKVNPSGVKVFQEKPGELFVNDNESWLIAYKLKFLNELESKVKEEKESIKDLIKLRMIQENIKKVYSNNFSFTKSESKGISYKDAFLELAQILNANKETIDDLISKHTSTNDRLSVNLNKVTLPEQFNLLGEPYDRLKEFTESTESI